MAANILPPNVRTKLASGSALAHTRGMAIVRKNQRHTNHMIRIVAVNKSDEIGPAEAAAVRKVLNLPVQE